MDASPLSLLWPGTPPSPAAADGLARSAADDLKLGEIVAAIVGGAGSRVRLQQREHFARQTLSQLCTSADVITYRQAAFQDLVDDPLLQERLADIVPRLEELSDAAAMSERIRPAARDGLQRMVQRLAELEVYVSVARELHDALDRASVRSSALQRVRDEVRQLAGSAAFRALELELPRLRATLGGVRSVTVGVNLGADLAPQSASIMGFGTEPIKGQQALLGRLLGGAVGTHGITPLRRAERTPEGWQNELQRDLAQLLQDLAAPVATALRTYASVSTRRLARLGAELGFLLGGVRLVERLRRAGLPTCQPEIVGCDERCTELEDAYDPSLALRLPSSALITNPVVFDEKAARVWVLSGPNRSGKTTFLRALGLVHVFAQAGLHVPARSARLSVVDAIHTHFPAREQARPGMGRLDEEAEALATIFKQATPHSLVLLNEALAGTSTFEAIDLARGVLRGLRVLGARAVYVTHLHELGAAVGEINATTPGRSCVGSLVSELDVQAASSGRNFRIRPGAPRGQSFAARIAEQHGISYSQLLALLRQRGIADGSTPAPDGH